MIWLNVLVLLLGILGWVSAFLINEEWYRFCGRLNESWYETCRKYVEELGRLRESEEDDV